MTIRIAEVVGYTSTQTEVATQQQITKQENITQTKEYILSKDNTSSGAFYAASGESFMNAGED